MPRRRTLYWLAAPALAAGALGLAIAASDGPHDPFVRYAPEVDAAVADLNAARYGEANERLTRYLRLQGCHEGVLQTPPGATDSADAAFDLGLGLFGAAEKLGQRFEDVDDAEPPGANPGGPPTPGGPPAPGAPPAHGGARPGGPAAGPPSERRSDVDCARMLLGALLERRMPAELEARARYLRGNAAFLERRWDEALADYDRALRLAPGSDAAKADALGRDLAWNRALALRNREREKEREKEKQKENEGQGGQGGAPPNEKSGQGGSPDQGQKAPDPKQDDAKNEPPNGGQEGAGGAGGQGQGEQGGQGGGGPNEEPKAQNAGGQGQSDPNQAPNGPPPRNAGNQDEHMLDQFEQAPTWQREEGKARGAGRKLRGVSDK